MLSNPTPDDLYAETHSLNRTYDRQKTKQTYIPKNLTKVKTKNFKIEYLAQNPKIYLILKFIFVCGLYS